jgi:hypothetical protein
MARLRDQDDEFCRRLRAAVERGNEFCPTTVSTGHARAVLSLIIRGRTNSAAIGASPKRCSRHLSPGAVFRASFLWMLQVRSISNICGRGSAGWVVCRLLSDKVETRSAQIGVRWLNDRAKLRGAARDLNPLILIWYRRSTWLFTISSEPRDSEI